MKQQSEKCTYDLCPRISCCCLYGSLISRVKMCPWLTIIPTRILGRIQHDVISGSQTQNSWPTLQWFPHSITALRCPITAVAAEVFPWIWKLRNIFENLKIIIQKNVFFNFENLTSKKNVGFEADTIQRQSRFTGKGGSYAIKPLCLRVLRGNNRI